MPLFKYLLIGLAIAGLTGCAAPYRPPVLQGNAVVDFKSASGITMLFLYPDGIDCTNQMYLSKEDDPLTNSTQTLVLEANKRIALNLIWRTPGKVCQVVVSLRPEVDGRYGLMARYEGQFCRANLVDRNNHNQPVGQNVGVQQMKFVKDASGAYKCEPLIR